MELKNKDPSGDWMLGEKLRARIKGADGRRFHELMREPKPGDLVIHIQQTKEDGWNIVALSRVRDGFNKPGPNNQYYERRLTGLTEWRVPINKLLSRYGSQIRREIDSSHPKYYPFRRRGNSVGLIRAPYLSKATKKLVNIFSKVVPGDGTRDRRPENGAEREQDSNNKGTASPPSVHMFATSQNTR